MKIAQIAPRRAAEQHFDAERMVAAYEHLYAGLIEDGTIPATRA